MKKILLSILEALLIIVIIAAASLTASTVGPAAYRKTLREYVSLRTFIIIKDVRGKPEGGTGTGVQVKTKSGKVVILTNRHICNSVENSGYVFVETNTGIFTRDPKKLKIIAKSDSTDLCIIESYNNKFLKITNPPEIGNTYHTLGFPNYRRETMLSGELSGTVYKVKVALGTIGKDLWEWDCKGPHDSIEFIEGKEICMSYDDAYQTTIPSFGGSSGSPMFDYKGDIVGLIYATDSINLGLAVTNQDIVKFLNKY